MCVLPKANICRLGCAVALAAFLLVGVGGRAFADTGCLNTATSLSQDEIDAFLANPSGLLERYPAGGPAMSAHVQRLAASDMSTVHALIALAKNAKPMHVVSLSMGLGRAATRCSAKRPDITQAIKLLVAAEGSPSFKALFSSESTVSELALGAPPGVGTAATAEATRSVADNQPGAPPAATLNTIIKARTPGFLLPTTFGKPTGAETDTRVVTPYVGGGQSYSPAADDPSATPLGYEGGPVTTSSLPGGPNFFGKPPSDEPDTQSGAKDQPPTAFAFRSRRLASEDEPDKRSGDGDSPSFGTGGLTDTSQDVMSPTQ